MLTTEEHENKTTSSNDDNENLPLVDGDELSSNEIGEEEANSNSEQNSKKLPTTDMRSAADVMEDVNHQGRFKELFNEILTDLKENQHISIQNWPEPFNTNKTRKWKRSLPYLIVILLLILLLGLLNGLLVVQDQSQQIGKDFTNVFCTIFLILFTGIYIFKLFSILIDLSLLLFIGLSLIKLGSFLLFSSFVFLTNDLIAQTWLNFACLCIISCGSVIFVGTTIVDGLLPHIIGSFILTIGLIILAIASYYRVFNSVTFSGISIAGASIVFIGCVIMSIQSGLDLERPFLKPKNYFLWGSVLYGIGAFTFIWPSAIPLSIQIYPDNEYGVNIRTTILASLFFLLGSDFLQISSFRRFVLLDKVLEDRYPLTCQLNDTITSSLLFWYCTCLLFPASFLPFIGFIFYPENMDVINYLLLVGYILTFLSFAGVFCSFVLTKREKPLLIGGLFLSIGFLLFIFSIFTFWVNPISAQQLQISSVILIGCSSLPVSWICFKYKVPMTISFQINFKSFVQNRFWYILHPGHHMLFVFTFGLPLWSLFWLLGCLAQLGYITLVSSVSFWCFSQYFLIYSALSLLLHGYLRKTMIKSTSLTSSTSITNKQIHQLINKPMNLPESLRHQESTPLMSPDGGEKKKEDDLIQVDVLIVGGGPCGLTLVNELGSRDVKTMLIEQRSTCISDARFLVLNPATCEGLKQLGVLEEILKYLEHTGINPDIPYGASWLTGLLQEDAKLVASCTTPGRNVLMSSSSIGAVAAASSMNSTYASQACVRMMQSQQETVLKQCAEKYPCVDIKFGHVVQTFSKNGRNGNIVSIERLEDGHIFKVQCKYLVACEGPNGPIAQKLGVLFDGFINVAPTQSILFHAPGLWEKVVKRHGFSHQYLITRENQAAAFVCCDPVRGLWNVPVKFPRGDQNEDRVAVIRSFVGEDQQIEIMAGGNWHLNFFIAQNYRYGNILLAGDAAHSWPPFGGIGGNTAFGDANNLGWKLAAVLKGWGGDTLLDSYATERRQHALRTAMYVKAITPKPERLLLSGKLQHDFPWMEPFLRMKFSYANRGVQNNNHFAQDGVSLGIRYDLSPIVIRESIIQLPDDAYCHYIPRVLTGSRLPSFYIDKGQGPCCFDLLNKQGFTLFTFDSADENYVNLLLEKFMENGIPIKMVNIEGNPTDGHIGSRFESAASYLTESLVLARPDRIVCWHQRINEEELSPERMDELILIVSGMGWKTADDPACVAFDKWLLAQFHHQMKGLENTFPKAVQIKGQTKSEAIAQAKLKTKDQVEILTKMKAEV